MVKKLVSVSMLAVALGLTAGCATTQSVDEVRAMAQSAQQANTCCSDTNAKIDRMFQKSMHK